MHTLKLTSSFGVGTIEVRRKRTVELLTRPLTYHKISAQNTLFGLGFEPRRPAPHIIYKGEKA